MPTKLIWSGIVTSENNKLYVKKKNGLALDSFSEDDLKLLVGKIGVAHNRYSTTGSIMIIHNH